MIGFTYQIKNRKSKERLIPIIEGIINDNNYEESAVNIPNDGFIKQIPNDIIVKVSIKRE